MSNEAAQPAETPVSSEITPDTKDWTWVLTATCPDCGANVSQVPGPQVGGRIGGFVDRWRDVLGRPDVATRPKPGTWSPLEYACHVRDVFDVFAKRTRLILGEENPTFADWDQDAAAVVGRYRAQEPGAVARDLAAAAGAYASLLAQVPDDAWQRQGLRSNGSAFTLETLTQYFLHDILHHLADVQG